MKAKTHSLQLILDPVVREVEHLTRLTEGSTGGAQLPNLVGAASSVREALIGLKRVLDRELLQIPNEQLKEELCTSCQKTLLSSDRLVEAAHSLRKTPRSHYAIALLRGSTEGIKQGLIELFTCWDDASVKQITEAGQLSLDKLEIMCGSRSMRSLVLCFRGYADAMKIVLAMIDQRQKELLDQEEKRLLFESLSQMKALLPRFSSAMQVYVKTQTDHSKREKDAIHQKLSVALGDLLQCVDDTWTPDNPSMAKNVERVQERLSRAGGQEGYSVGPDLDRHITAVVKNSRAVASVSSEEYKKAILKECNEVLELKDDLGNHADAVSAAPSSIRAKRAFDRCAQKLCEKLNELEWWVKDSVVHQVADAFMETTGPLNHLVDTAHGRGQKLRSTRETSTPRETSAPRETLTPRSNISTPRKTFPPTQSSQFRASHHDEEKAAPGRRQRATQTPPTETDRAAGGGAEEVGLKKQVQVFRRHSQRLGEVASYAAQRSKDTRHIKQIEELAGKVDRLTTKVADKAQEVSSNPGQRNREELDSLRQEWTTNVHKLKRVIDDIVDPEDFISLSEATIQQDIDRCRGAVKHRNWEVLNELVLRITAKARRAHEVGLNALAKATDHTYKNSLSQALDQLDKAIPRVVSTSKKLKGDPDNSEAEAAFISSLKAVTQCLRNIQNILGTAVEVTSNVDEDDLLPADTSTPSRPGGNMKKSTFQERWMKRSLNKGGGSGESPQGSPSWRTSPHKKPSYEDDGDVSWSRSGPGKGSREDLSHSGRSQASVSGTGQRRTRSPTKDKASQVEHQYINFSMNATRGSTVSPDSSTSSWTPPISMEHTPRSVTSRDTTATPTTFKSTTPTAIPSLAINPLYTPHISPPLAPPPPLSLPPDNNDDEEEEESAEEEEEVGVVGPLQTSTDVAMSTYMSPLEKLVSATKRRNVGDVADCTKNLEARAIRLAELANTAASTVEEDTELAKVIRTKSEEVSMLTPKLIKQARAASRSQQDRGQAWDDFQATSQKWAGHVRDLIEATQEANLPWSQSAKELVQASEKGEDLEDKMKHISMQTDRMVDIATLTMKAAQTEDAIGGANQEVDLEMKEQVESVKTKVYEIKKLTPQLLEAAEMASRQPFGSASSEHLHLKSQEWATKAKVLMKGVDDITLGMGGAADTLILAAQSGDTGLLHEQAKSIKTLANSLQTMAKDAVEGCENEEKVKVVRVVAKEIAKLSVRLVDCASEMSATFQGEEEGEEPPLAVREEAELLRREWSSQVHLLTAHIDHMTAEASAPLDRLMELSLAANRTSGLAQQHLMKKFEDKSSSLLEQLETVETLFNEATMTGEMGQKKPPEMAITNSKAAIKFLRNLAPHAIGAVRYLATDAGSAMLEHFNHLHRQWATKAQFLLANLHKIKTADMGPTLEAFLALLHDSAPVSPKAVQVEMSDVSDTSNQSSRVDLSSPLHRSYSSEHITPTTRFDYEDTELHAPSTPSVELRAKKKKPYIPTLAEMGLRHVPQRQKRRSVTSTPPAWAAPDSGDEMPSFESVTAAAMSLREFTDEFMDDDNPLISVGKAISEQMTQMADFGRGRGDLQSKADMINTAKAAADNSNKIFKIAQSICKHCRDQKTKSNLQCHAEMIPTLSTQLTMLASVRSSTAESNYAGDLMLIKNAQNLMKAVINTVRAAEAACMKNLTATGENSMAEEEEERGPDTALLAMSWKKKLYHHRAKETGNAPRGARGLRMVNKFRSAPSAADIIVPSEEYLKTPRKQN